MATRRASSRATEHRHRRILVVDDDARVSDLVREVLDCQPGCEVRVAGLAAEALSQTEVQPLDTVITDLHMPGMDCLDLMAGSRRNIRVLV